MPKNPRLRGEAVFERDSRPTQHVIDRHVLEEYDKGVQRTSSPPAEPLTVTARRDNANQAVPADK